MRRNPKALFLFGGDKHAEGVPDYSLWALPIGSRHITPHGTLQACGRRCNCLPAPRGLLSPPADPADFFFEKSEKRPCFLLCVMLLTSHIDDFFNKFQIQLEKC